MIPPEEAVKPLRVGGWARRVIGDARDASVGEIREGEEPRAFYLLEWWKKVIVMAGGPVVNLVLAAILFTVVLTGFGTPQQTLTVRDIVECVPAAGPVECAASDPASPAAVAGIRAGDTFVSVDGAPLETWGELTAYVAARPGQSVELVVDRAGEQVDLTLVPATRERPSVDAAGQPLLDADGEPIMESVGFMGVYALTEQVSQPPLAGIQLTGQYIGAMVPVILNLPGEVVEVGKAALGMQERDAQGIMGVVGVGRAAGEIASADVEGYGAQEKIADMLLLLGGLNLALFLFNMIPLVPLDGGHIASAIWQALKNFSARLRGASKPRPVDVARMMPLAYGVFGALIVMTVVLVFADIVAPVSLT